MFEKVDISEPFCFWRIRDIGYTTLLVLGSCAMVAFFLVLLNKLFLTVDIPISSTTMIGMIFLLFPVGAFGALRLLLRFKKMPLSALGLSHLTTLKSLFPDTITKLLYFGILLWAFTINSVPFIREIGGFKTDPGDVGTNIFFITSKALFIILLMPVAEELVFRSIITSALYNFFKQELPALIISALFFALLHMLGTKSPLMYFVAILPLSFVLTYTFIRLRQIYTPIIIHISFNAVSITTSVIFADSTF